MKLSAFAYEAVACLLVVVCACSVPEVDAVSKPAVVVAPIRQPVGYYQFRPAVGKIIVPPKNKYISGLVIRGTHAAAQPTKDGPISFAREKAAIDQCAKQNQECQVEMFGGAATAKWMGGVNAQLDEVNIVRREKLIAEMGRQLASCSNIVAVHACSPMTTSPEFKFDGTSFTTADFPRALAAFKRELIALGKAFTKCVVVLNMHNPQNAKDGFVAQQIAAGKQILGKRFAVQENSFKADPAHKTYNLYSLVQQHAADGYPAGYEQVEDSSAARYGGTFASSLGQLGKSQWLIVYEKDVPKIVKPWGAK